MESVYICTCRVVGYYAGENGTGVWQIGCSNRNLFLDALNIKLLSYWSVQKNAPWSLCMVINGNVTNSSEILNTAAKGYLFPRARKKLSYLIYQ